MDGLTAAIKAAAIWSQAAHIGPIRNSNFYVLLFIPIGIVVLAHLVRPRTKRGLGILMAALTITLLPTAAFVLCVGITMLAGV